jgi:hypothetical protein
VFNRAELYICDNCKEVFEVIPDNLRQATMEMVEMFGEELPEGERMIVCDDCYQLWLQVELARAQLEYVRVLKELIEGVG